MKKSLKKKVLLENVVSRSSYCRCFTFQSKVLVNCLDVGSRDVQ